MSKETIMPKHTTKIVRVPKKKKNTPKKNMPKKK